MIADNPSLQCHLCLSEHLILFDSFGALSRATSDCKPWPKMGKLCMCVDCCTVQKVIDSNWRTETKEIYANYELYHQSAGNKEQPVFDRINGQAKPRSLAILDYLQTMIDIKSRTRVIDIGCGVGNMLKSFSKKNAKAALYGFEPNTHKKEALEQIENVVQIYSTIDELKDNHFDLVTMVHVLEHVEAPLELLRSIKGSLSSDGYLVIAVPDYIENPFDLIIADHASHFSTKTLHQLILQSGFDVLTISNEIIHKEIIAICRSSSAVNLIREKEARIAADTQSFVQKQLDWLANVITDAKRIAQVSRPFGVFGTSIAANWIYGELEPWIDFFVDEDVDRVDRLYRQKPVYSVKNAPKNSHMYVCLQPNVASKVIDRISSNNYALYGTPSF